MTTITASPYVSQAFHTYDQIREYELDCQEEFFDLARKLDLSTEDTYELWRVARNYGAACTWESVADREEHEPATSPVARELVMTR